jgi:hypothetical protein
MPDPVYDGRTAPKSLDPRSPEDILRDFYADHIDRSVEAFVSNRDYFALIEAINVSRQSGRLPEKLATALVEVIEDEMQGGGRIRRWFEEHRAEVIAAARAEVAGDAERHGFTPTEANRFAAEFFGPTDTGFVSADAVRKSRKADSDRQAEGGGLARWTEQWRDRMYALAPSPEHAVATIRKWKAVVKAEGRYKELPGEWFGDGP